jgi:tetratricopeptide (TPR) repeat protein
MMKRLFLVSTLLVAGCAGSGQSVDTTAQQAASTPERLLANDLFDANRDSQPISVEEFLALPPDYIEQLNATVLIHDEESERYDALRDWAFDGIQADLEYDPAFTSPIGELEDSDRINCFSFSNLFVAAARYSGIDASFQLVDSPPQWDMNNNTWLVGQHINVTGKVSRKLTDREVRDLRQESLETGSRIQTKPESNVRRTYIADLNPEIAVDSYRARIITDRQALSLYYSNRSVEKLLGGDREAATRLGLLAVRVDEESSTAWNNMGVLFSRAGKFQEASDSYVVALRLDSTSPSPANNLERVYRRLGETAKADAMARRIAANRRKNPYYHYAMGATKLERGDLEDALQHFEEAIERKDDERLFYYGLAETQMKLGKYKRATRSLETAKEHSSSSDLWRYDQLYSQLRSARNGG